MGGVGNISGFSIVALLPGIIDAAMAAVSSETDMRLGILPFAQLIVLENS